MTAHVLPCLACLLASLVCEGRAQNDFLCCVCALLLLGIDRQQQKSSNSEAGVRCSQRPRGQQSSMYLQVPAARCCGHIGRYAPGTVLLAGLTAVCRHFLHISSSHPRSGTEPSLACKRIYDMYVRTIIVQSTLLFAPLLVLLYSTGLLLQRAVVAV